ncbi:hypothetical protein [uncultured Deinococcus sp.]|nr:hypothetical protein [uncultured Deinococcus sp.]
MTWFRRRVLGLPLAAGTAHAGAPREPGVNILRRHRLEPEGRLTQRRLVP